MMCVDSRGTPLHAIEPAPFRELSSTESEHRLFLSVTGMARAHRPHPTAHLTVYLSRDRRGMPTKLPLTPSFTLFPDNQAGKTGKFSPSGTVTPRMA